MGHDRNSGMLTAFGAGLLLGAAAGLLLAPASGVETRRRIGESAGRAVDRGKSLASDTAEKGRKGVRAAGDFVKGQKERVAGAFREGREAFIRESKG